VGITIKNLNPKKAPSYDLITNQLLQKLPETGIKYIIQICNAIRRGSLFQTSMEGMINYYDPEF
jgi:hypothetical protein